MAAATMMAIAGTACVVYGATVMMVGSGTWFFSFWYALGALLLASAWGVHAGWWDALPTTARRAALACIALALAGFGVTLGLQAKEFGQKGEPELDYIIVLGAQVRDGGPSSVLQFRLDVAFDYLTANDSTICIVSGAQGPNEPTAEADAMAEYLQARGIEPARIIRETAARNTAQNIAYSMAYLNPASDSVGIVTNNFHVFRGVALARKAGIANVCGIAAESTAYYLPNNMVRESLGIVKDFLKGNL